MAIENAKTLNVRIKNKYDSYENWAASGLVLEAGEIAIAYSTVDVQVDNGTVKHPFLLMKVGDGEKTFANLPWLSAKAADVLECVKSEAGLTAFVKGVVAAADGDLANLTTRVTTAEGDIDAIQLELDKADTGLKARMTTAEADIEALEAKFGADTVAAEIATALANYSTTEQMNGAIATAKGEATAHADGLNTAMNTRVEALEAIDHEHANKAELDLIATGDKAKWDAMEQNAKDYADGLDEVMDGRVAALEAKFGEGEGNVADQIADAVATEKSEREVADTELGNRVTTIENDYLKAADKTELAGDISDNAAAIAALEDLVGDTKVSTAIDTAVAAEQTRAEAAEKANADAITVLNGNAETEGSVDYKIAQKFSTLMENPDEAMNSIQELVDWTTEHAADALEMSNQVTANKNAIATLNGDASTAGSVDKKIADAIAAENLDQYATDTELTGVDDRLKAVEAMVSEDGAVKSDIADALAEAKGYTDTEVKELADGAVATNAAAIADLEDLVGDTKVATQITNAINEALKIDGVDKYALASALTAAIEQHNTDKAALEEAIALKANDADLAAIAKTGSTDDLVQGELVLVFDCGTSAV